MIAACARVLAVVALAAAAGCNTSEAARTGSPAPHDSGAAAAAAAPADATASDSALLARADSARIQGSPTAPLWLVEISDFQCPYCKQWHDSTYDAIRRDYVATGKVRMAYVNFPLPMHAHAVDAAEAAMCAGTQHRFWEMHDALFRAQDEWGPVADPAPVFARLAAAQGLDSARWAACMASDVTMPLVRADAERANQAGVRSTPTFLVGGVALPGAYPYEPMAQLIDSLLAASGR